MELRRVVWLFPVALAAHNLEEAIWLPAWSRTPRLWHPAVGDGEFRFAVAVVTLLGVWATWTASRGRGQGVAAHVFGASLVIMLFNAVLPHLVATMFTRTYMPGLLTAAVCVAPACVYLLRRALREGFVRWRALLLWSVGLGAGVLALLPLLFRLGRTLT